MLIKQLLGLFIIFLYSKQSIALILGPVNYYEKLPELMNDGISLAIKFEKYDFSKHQDWLKEPDFQKIPNESKIFLRPLLCKIRYRDLFSDNFSGEFDIITDKDKNSICGPLSGNSEVTYYSSNCFDIYYEGGFAWQNLPGFVEEKLIQLILMLFTPVKWGYALLGLFASAWAVDETTDEEWKNKNIYETKAYQYMEEKNKQVTDWVEDFNLKYFISKAAIIHSIMFSPIILQDDQFIMGSNDKEDLFHFNTLINLYNDRISQLPTLEISKESVHLKLCDPEKVKNNVTFYRNLSNKLN